MESEMHKYCFGFGYILEAAELFVRKLQFTS